MMIRVGAQEKKKNQSKKRRKRVLLRVVQALEVDEWDDITADILAG